MKFKILCSDLDGTLLSSKSDVSDITIREIERIKKKMKVILVSARMPSGMRYLQARLGIQKQPIICYNGALVLDGNREVFSKVIPIQIINDIYTLSEPLGTDLGLYYNDEWFVPKVSKRVEKEVKYTKTQATFRPTLTTITAWGNRNIGAHKIMLMGTKESADILMPILKEKFKDTLNSYRSNDTLIEVAPKSVSKLTAIKHLLTSNETLQDIIAFGDNYNDIEMLENVACGVAVGNAREEVKETAHYTTLNNTEDGVAQFICEHLHI